MAKFRCSSCGMLIDQGQFHPFAACVAVRDGWTVRGFKRSYRVYPERRKRKGGT